MPRRTAKTMAKEINRKGDAEVVSSNIVPLAPPRPLQPPKKITYAEKAFKMEERRPKGIKGLKKIHKRTGPGNFPHEYSAPAHVHPEGERWIKTLNTQDRENSRVFTKRMTKQTGRKKI